MDDAFQSGATGLVISVFDEYKHTSSQNDRWQMRLKLIQEEYYSIGNLKS